MVVFPVERAWSLGSVLLAASVLRAFLVACILGLQGLEANLHQHRSILQGYCRKANPLRVHVLATLPHVLRACYVRSCDHQMPAMLMLPKTDALIEFWASRH